MILKNLPSAALQGVGRSLKHILIPAACLGCGRPVSDPHSLCGDCWDALGRLPSPRCRRCDLPLEGDAAASQALLCRPCQRRTPAYDRALAVFSYEKLVRTMILRFKYRDTPLYTVWLARSLKLALQERADPAAFDGVIAMAASFQSLYRRRYNQAAELARPLAKMLEKPFYTSLLHRHRTAGTLRGATRAGRFASLRAAFYASPPPSGVRRLLLVDDVMTTGASFHFAAAALKEAGIREVVCLAVCRVGDSSRTAL